VAAPQYVFFALVYTGSRVRQLGLVSVTLVLASLVLIDGILNIALFSRIRSLRWHHYPVTGARDLHAMAVEFGLGDRHIGRRELIISGATRVMLSLEMRKATDTISSKLAA
jgi:hypothetical protein